MAETSREYIIRKTKCEWFGYPTEYRDAVIDLYVTTEETEETEEEITDVKGCMLEIVEDMMIFFGDITIAGDVRLNTMNALKNLYYSILSVGDNGISTRD